MAKKYLDDSGLSYLWGKLKDIFQVKLVSGTNIKTINNNSLLGSGNITISGGGGSVTVDDALSTTSENPVQNKVITNNFANYVPKSGNGWITASGTSDGWTYRKYSDGTFDAWGTFNKTPTSSTASGNIYYSNSISQSLPFTAVADSVIATGSVGAQYAWLVNTSAATTTVSFRVARGTTISTTTALAIRLHVHGAY